MLLWVLAAYGLTVWGVATALNRAVLADTHLSRGAVLGLVAAALLVNLAAFLVMSVFGYPIPFGKAAGELAQNLSLVPICAFLYTCLFYSFLRTKSRRRSA